VARRVEESLTHSRPYGIAVTMERAIAAARAAAQVAEREEVAREVGQIVRESRLSRAEFASRVGTSPSRLSTYVTGKVTPSAALLVRMRRTI
jgi:ribosome-binding protein aMBF1 (putative translation factor)